jgi:hypothetical protein
VALVVHLAGSEIWADSSVSGSELPNCSLHKSRAFRKSVLLHALVHVKGPVQGHIFRRYMMSGGSLSKPGL